MEKGRAVDTWGPVPQKVWDVGQHTLSLGWIKQLWAAAWESDDPQHFWTTLCRDEEAASERAAGSVAGAGGWESLVQRTWGAAFQEGMRGPLTVSATLRFGYSK